jgi:hypothetical protein
LVAEGARRKIYIEMAKSGGSASALAEVKIYDDINNIKFPN